MASIFAHTCFRRMLGYNSGLNSSTPCFFKSVACMCWLLGPYFLGRWMCGYRCCNGVSLNGFWVSCVFCDCPIISDHRYCSIFGEKRGDKNGGREQNFVVKSLLVRAMFLHRNPEFYKCDWPSRKTWLTQKRTVPSFSKNRLCKVVSVYEFASVRTCPSFWDTCDGFSSLLFRAILNRKLRVPGSKPV